tara:strand:+ start:367 stop:837 length:471 start_codon:yes stop_codon:yes gene_type:complete
VKLNTNISIENVITIFTMICAVILAFGFMQYDIDALKKELESKADQREVIADRELITYKLDVMMEDIAEIKEILKEKRIMDWLNWQNAAYLIAIILGGVATMVGTKWRMIIRELKEVAETYHEAKKDGKVTKEEEQKIAKECMDVLSQAIKMVWKF